MVKHKLLKRVLPMLLSASMMFQTVSGTALAAEIAPEAVSAQEQSDETVATSEDDAQDAVEAETADGAQDAVETETADGSQDAVEAETADGSQDTADVTDADDADGNDSATADNTEDADAADADAVLDEEASGGDSQGDPSPKSENEAAKLPQAVISLDKEALKEAISYTNYKYDEIAGTLTADYHSIKDIEDLTENISGVLNSEVYSNYSYKYPLQAYYTDSEGSEIPLNKSDDLKYTWKVKGADDAYTDIKATEGEKAQPDAAGSYRLVISADAKEGSYTAADPVNLDLEIKKSVITAEVTNLSFDSADSAAEVKKANEIITFYVNGEEVDRGEYEGEGEAQKVVYKGDYISGASLNVVNADDASKLSDADLLKKGVNYVIETEVTLKDDVKANYEAAKDSFRISLTGSVNTTIEITYKDEVLVDGAAPEVIFTKTYNGEPVNAETDVKTKYTAKVIYGEGDNKKEVAGAEITGTWCVQNGFYSGYSDIDYEPTDAGEYYYKLSYTDADKAYGDADPVYLKVVINKVSLAIEPVIENTEFYSGITAENVVKYLEAKVYDVSGETPAEKTVGENFWGAYNGKPYVPVFKVQKGTKAAAAESVTTWEDVDDEERLTISADGNVSYRVVFADEFAAYSKGYDGQDRNDTQDVDSVNYSFKNYEVVTTDDIKDKYSKAITLKAATEVKINVDGLLNEGAGATLENPVIKTYDGKGIYTSIADYKKATVTKADGAEATFANGELKYEWQSNSSVTLEEGKPVENDIWRRANYNNVDICVAPMNVGVYRLAISYTDDTNESYAAEPAYVYYVVKPQDVRIVINAETEAYAKADAQVESTYEFIHKLQNSNAEDKATYFSLEVYPVTVTEDAEGNANVVKGEAPIAELTEAVREEYSGDLYYDPGYYFYVEKKSTVEGKDVWTGIDTDYEIYFEVNAEYRLGVANINYDRNYNFGRKYDKYNNIVNYDYYANETSAITVKATEGKKLNAYLTEDIDKVVKTKEYDGQPFDVNAIKQAVVVTQEDGKTEVTDQVNIEYYLVTGDFSSNDPNKYEYDEWYPLEGAIHAGEYRLVIEVATDDTYIGTGFTDTTPYIINQKELKITPVLKDPVYAGRYEDDYDIIIDHYDVEGIVDGDSDVIDYIYWDLYKRSDSTVVSYNTMLKSSGEYYVDGSVEYGYYEYEENGYWHEGYWDRDYKAAVDRKTFIPTRKAATIVEKNTEIKDEAVLTDGVYTHTVTTNEAVPYSYKAEWPNDSDIVTKDGEALEGNILTARLYAPEEFKGTDYEDGTIDADTLNAIEKNFIANNKGWVISSSTGDSSNYMYRNLAYIDVAFDASEHDKKEFTIMWAAGYTEKYVFDFSSSLLQADFTKAEAPKSISFNGPSKKMVVGDAQQLDVKIAKFQMNDIICLDYSVDNSSVLYVDSKGKVTALSKGKATVTVYPSRLVNGVKKHIDGAKTAKVTINVADVATVKISKLTNVRVGTDDPRVTVSYKKPANGYKREIYILEGKKKVEDFESELSKVKNGNYSAFVYAASQNGEPTDKKGVTSHVAWVDSLKLKPGVEYTLYLRNVSNVRKVAGSETDTGVWVSLSHAGSVKTFKTTKPQVEDLSLSFPDNIYYDEDYDEWHADFKDKSVQLQVEAKFKAKYTDSNVGDSGYIWRSLPLSSDLKRTYDEPKLQYNIYDYDPEKEEEIYSKSNDIASINNKGKITFKGAGHVSIRVTDTKSGIYEDIELYIEASPNSITGGAIKMKVGDTIDLRDYLTYKENKKKVANYAHHTPRLELDKTSDANFSIDTSTDEYGDTYAAYIIALKPNATLELKVTDKTVKANGGAPATIKITTSAIDPVKKLKADTVYDDLFRVRFSYPICINEDDDNDLAFKYELKDDRGSVICSKIEIPEYANDYDSKTKEYIYLKEFNSGDYPAINILSKYKLTVTVVNLNGGGESKPANLNIKTTNIVASKCDADDGYWEDDGYWDDNGNWKPDLYWIDGWYYGNTDINVINGTWNDTLESMEYDGRSLISGNIYTLDVPLEGDQDNIWARIKKTDTLTWKSTNTKVATVKANAGSYTATFKALKAGTTTIEVTSKITKKVIARYEVTVSAVGNADAYYGDNDVRQTLKR